MCDSFSSSCLQGIEKSSSGSMLSNIVGPGVFLIYKHLLLNRTTIALTVWGGLKHMKQGSDYKDKTWKYYLQILLLEKPVCRAHENW